MYHLYIFMLLINDTFMWSLSNVIYSLVLLQWSGKCHHTANSWLFLTAHSTSVSTEPNSWSGVVSFEIAISTSSYTKVPVSETSLAACMARLAVRSPHRRSFSRCSTADNLAYKRGYPRWVFVLRIANFEVSFLLSIFLPEICTVKRIFFFS